MCDHCQCSKLPPRKEVVAFIRSQLNWQTPASSTKQPTANYGKQELRELMDFLYGGEPVNDDEKIL